MPIQIGNRQVGDIYIGANGVNRKVTDGWIGSASGNQKIYSSGTLLGNLPVGSIVKIRENGVLSNFKVAQHNYIQTGVTAIERVLCGANYVTFNTTSYNIYDGSTLDTYLTDTYRNALDQYVRDALVKVSIPVTVGGGNNNIITIKRDVFVFSVTEVGLSTTDANNVEGIQADIYTDNESRIKYSDDAPTTACKRWTRTPSTKNNSTIWRVAESGTLVGTGAYAAERVAPVLSLSSAFLV